MQTASDYDLAGCVAYSYARFSDPSQSTGHSLERQQEYAPEFCKEFGCKLDATLSFQDTGKSAFHGRHIAEGGGLSRFVACIEAGRVKPNDVLIIENLDRVSRLPLGQAEDLLKSILGTGVRIHTRSPWAIYDRATLNDPMQRMQMIFEFTRSHRESKYKQERLSLRWVRNREHIRQGDYHLANLPGWLRAKKLDGKVTGYEVMPEHAVTVRRIFKLCLDGYGLNAIAKKLNDSATPTMGKSDYWCRSSIAKLLKNRALIGEYQPFTSVKLEGRNIVSTKRVATGEPIKDHYPKIIDDATFEQAELSLAKRKSTQSGAGTNKVVNLFSGMLRDARDGSTMQVVDKGYGLQLVSGAARSGVISAAYVPYQMIEQMFVVYVDRMPLDMIMPKDTGKLDTNIKRLQKDVESLKLQIAKIKDKTRTSTSDALLELLVERDVELKTKLQEIEALERQRGSAATVAASTSKELLQIISKAKGDQLIALRTKLRNELRYWIKQVTILPMKLGTVKAAMVDVELANGEHLDFRASEELIDWPEELDGRSVLDFPKWPKAIRKTQWEALTTRDNQLIELHDKGESIQSIADATGQTPSVVSRRLIALGRRRSKRTILGGNRLMTWNNQSHGWQRTRNGKRFYIGCGALKKLYPKLVKSLDEQGTIRAANQWWKDNVEAG